MVLVILAEGGLAFDFPLTTYGDRFVSHPPLKPFHRTRPFELIFSKRSLSWFALVPVLLTASPAASRLCRNMSSSTLACQNSDKFF
jgi:hypothetical protein